MELRWDTNGNTALSVAQELLMLAIMPTDAEFELVRRHAIYGGKEAQLPLGASFVREAVAEYAKSNPVESFEASVLAGMLTLVQHTEMSVVCAVASRLHDRQIGMASQNAKDALAMIGTNTHKIILVYTQMLLYLRQFGTWAPDNLEDLPKQHVRWNPDGHYPHRKHSCASCTNTLASFFAAAVATVDGRLCADHFYYADQTMGADRKRQPMMEMIAGLVLQHHRGTVAGATSDKTLARARKISVEYGDQLCNFVIQSEGNVSQAEELTIDAICSSLSTRTDEQLEGLSDAFDWVSTILCAAADDLIEIQHMADSWSWRWRWYDDSSLDTTCEGERITRLVTGACSYTNPTDTKIPCCQRMVSCVASAITRGDIAELGILSYAPNLCCITQLQAHLARGCRTEGIVQVLLRQLWKLQTTTSSACLQAVRLGARDAVLSAASVGATLVFSMCGLASGLIETLIPSTKPPRKHGAVHSCRSVIIYRDKSGGQPPLTLDTPHSTVCLQGLSRGPMVPATEDLEGLCVHGMEQRDLLHTHWWALATSASYGRHGSVNAGVRVVRAMRACTTLLGRCHLEELHLRCSLAEVSCATMFAKLFPQLVVELFSPDECHRTAIIFDTMADEEAAVCALVEAARRRLYVVYVGHVSNEGAASELTRTLRKRLSDVQNILYPGWFVALLVYS